METLKNLTAKSTGEKLTLFPEASHVSHTLSGVKEKAAKIIETSGRGSLMYAMKLGQIGLLVRMLLISSIWNPKDSLMTWKTSAIKEQYWIFELALLDYRRWNGIYGLLPRPTKSDAKGSGKKRFRTSPHYKGNFREAIRESWEDGIYPNPDFAEWVKGIPEGWTNVQEQD